MTVTLEPPTATAAPALPIVGILVAPAATYGGITRPVHPRHAECFATFALHDGADPTCLSTDFETSTAAEADAARLAARHNVLWEL